MRSRSKSRLMTPGRWVLAIVSALLLLFLLFNLYYRSTQQDIWQEENAAKRIAIEQAGLTEVDKATKHVWDQISWVIQGKDSQGREQMVWVVGDQATIEPVEAGIAKEKIEAKVLKDKPDARIIRIIPGLLNGERIWEVFYSREESVRKYYYEFYRFSDGSFITIYNLPSKFSDGVD